MIIFRWEWPSFSDSLMAQRVDGWSPRLDSGSVGVGAQGESETEFVDRRRRDWPVGVARRWKGRLVPDDLHEGPSGRSVRRGGKGSALCASRRTQMPILMPILIPRERHGVKTGAGHDLRDGPWRYRRRATSHCRRIPLNGLVAP